jgi:hypothetical protein
MFVKEVLMGANGGLGFRAGYSWESRELLGIASGFGAHPLLFGASRVCSLNRRELLIVER